MIRRIALTIAIAAAGTAAALTLARTASAWDIHALPAGYTTQHIISGNGPCSDSYIVYGYGQSSPQLCTDSTTFQQDLDAFINATCPTAVCAPATTATTATTAATTTTTDPGVTVTQPTTTAAAAVPPTARFDTAATGLVVSFTDTSKAGSGAIAKVTWLFGDGANDIGTETKHAYTDPGTFNVIEIVTDANGLTDTASQQITVSPFGGQPAFAETLSQPLTAAATATFGQPLAVYCVSAWGKATAERGYGLSIVSSHQANVWQRGCAALATKTGPVGLALLVVGHEAAHALGITSERTADCYALKRIPALEKQLGIRDRGYIAAQRRYVNGRGGCAR